eukprot:ANDGO_03904.mRNA.1 hypothetical protein
MSTQDTDEEAPPVEIPSTPQNAPQPPRIASFRASPRFKDVQSFSGTPTALLRNSEGSAAELFASAASISSQNSFIFPKGSTFRKGSAISLISKQDETRVPGTSPLKPPPKLPKKIAFPRKILAATGAPESFDAEKETPTSLTEKEVLRFRENIERRLLKQRNKMLAIIAFLVLVSLSNAFLLSYVLFTVFTNKIITADGTVDIVQLMKLEANIIDVPTFEFGKLRVTNYTELWKSTVIGNAAGGGPHLLSVYAGSTFHQPLTAHSVFSISETGSMRLWDSAGADFIQLSGTTGSAGVQALSSAGSVIMKADSNKFVVNSAQSSFSGITAAGGVLSASTASTLKLGGFDSGSGTLGNIGVLGGGVTIQAATQSGFSMPAEAAAGGVLLTGNAISMIAGSSAVAVSAATGIALSTTSGDLTVVSSAGSVASTAALDTSFVTGRDTIVSSGGKTDISSDGTVSLVSKSSIQISASGSVSLSTPSNEVRVAANDAKFAVAKDTLFSVGGTMNVAATDMTLSASGKLSASSAVLVVSSSGPTTISSASIALSASGGVSVSSPGSAIGFTSQTLSATIVGDIDATTSAGSVKITSAGAMTLQSSDSVKVSAPSGNANTVAKDISLAASQDVSLGAARDLTSTSTRDTYMTSGSSISLTSASTIKLSVGAEHFDVSTTGIHASAFGSSSALSAAGISMTSPSDVIVGAASSMLLTGANFKAFSTSLSLQSMSNASISSSSFVNVNGSQGIDFQTSGTIHGNAQAVVLSGTSSSAVFSAGDVTVKSTAANVRLSAHAVIAVSSSTVDVQSSANSTVTAQDSVQLVATKNILLSSSGALRGQASSAFFSGTSSAALTSSGDVTVSSSAGSVFLSGPSFVSAIAGSSSLILSGSSLTTNTGSVTMTTTSTVSIFSGSDITLQPTTSSGKVWLRSPKVQLGNSTGTVTIFASNADPNSNATGVSLVISAGRGDLNSSGGDLVLQAGLGSVNGSLAGSVYIGSDSNSVRIGGTNVTTWLRGTGVTLGETGSEYSVASKSGLRLSGTYLKVDSTGTIDIGASTTTLNIGSETSKTFVIGGTKTKTTLLGTLCTGSTTVLSDATCVYPPVVIQIEKGAPSCAANGPNYECTTTKTGVLLHGTLIAKLGVMYATCIVRTNTFSVDYSTGVKVGTAFYPIYTQVIYTAPSVPGAMGVLNIILTVAGYSAFDSTDYYGFTCTVQLGG